MRKNVLVVEDDQSIAMVYETLLEKEGYQYKTVYDGQAALSYIAAQEPDAILLDLNLPDIGGLEVLQQIRGKGLECAVIVVTGKVSVNTAVEVMQNGADDFIAKPINPARLKVSLANALEKTSLKKMVRAYEDITRKQFCGMVGESMAMQAVYRIIENAAQSEAPVFVTGESGTGKELVSQAIHRLSSRNNHAIEALNCAAIPENLMESEIFGHVKGAFTGATDTRVGAARRAHQGTLFMDELGEMPMNLQSKLLRFIQTGTFTPVGSGRVETVDVRFVCATNRNPIQAIEQGVLRDDLYYRLNVIPIALPPLRDRGNDILLLAEHFLKSASEKEKRAFQGLSDDAKDKILSYDWPGNIRELQNTIWNAVIMNDSDILQANMISTQAAAGKPRPAVTRYVADNQNDMGANDDIKPLRVLERDMIERALDVCDGNITAAARKLEVNPSTLHRKMKKWDRA